MTPVQETVALGGWDWGIVGVYTLAVLGLGAWSRFGRSQNTEEYLVARHSMNWFVVGLAVFATLFSTISFVSSPGEAYSFGLVMMLSSLGFIVCLPLAVRLFLRFFFHAPTFTAYEYLERRFDRRLRILAAVFFLLIRLFYTASVFYAATVIFQTMLGWEPVTAMLAIGTVTILYAWMGGMRAVILADVIQSVIIFAGIVAILFRLLQLTGFDLGAVLQFAHRHDRTLEVLAQPEFYRLNFHDRWNIYLVVLGMVMAPLVSLSCDQMVIQRLLTGKNYRQAVRSVYANYWISVPVTVMLFGIGLFLFYYYNRTGAAGLPAHLSGDQALGYFVATELPAPLPGMVVTALLSALMSTVAGAINSLVTVFVKDIYPAVRPVAMDPEREVARCRRLTLLIGMLAVAVAWGMYASARSVRTTVLEVVGVWSTLWPILLTAFLYGVLSARVSARAVFTALVIAGSVGLAFPYVSYYLLPEEFRVGFIWTGIPGLVLALLLPPILSVFWPNRKNTDGLTLKTSRNFLRDE